METVEQPAASCPVCGSAKVRCASVPSAFWHDGRLVVIEDVPALVCGACGEQFYDDASVLMIDRMRAGGFPPEMAVREMNVSVFRLDRVARAGFDARPARGDVALPEIPS
jgi:YgiT-type zinc finger domain-containing protein